jgi:hypothetical protein
MIRAGLAFTRATIRRRRAIKSRAADSGPIPASASSHPRPRLGRAPVTAPGASAGRSSPVQGREAVAADAAPERGAEGWAPRVRSGADRLCVPAGERDPRAAGSSTRRTAGRMARTPLGPVPRSTPACVAPRVGAVVRSAFGPAGARPRSCRAPVAAATPSGPCASRAGGGAAGGAAPPEGGGVDSGGTGGCGAGAGGRAVATLSDAGGPTGCASTGGSSESGSTYPFRSAVRRMPRYTYGTASSGSPLGPTVPTGSRSETVSPRRTEYDPRWRSVTEYPSVVRIVTVLPPRGTVPANEIEPPAGAPTTVPLGAPMSIPRCCPAAYGSDPTEKPMSTGPETGQLQPKAGGAPDTAATTNRRTSRRFNTAGRPPLSDVQTPHDGSKAIRRCQIRLQGVAIEPIASHSGQPRH